jgi:hypothetical protein
MVLGFFGVVEAEQSETGTVKGKLCRFAMGSKKSNGHRFVGVSS